MVEKVLESRAAGTAKTVMALTATEAIKLEINAILRFVRKYEHGQQKTDEFLSWL